MSWLETCPNFRSIRHPEIRPFHGYQVTKPFLTHFDIYTSRHEKTETAVINTSMLLYTQICQGKPASVDE